MIIYIYIYIQRSFGGCSAFLNYSLLSSLKGVSIASFWIFFPSLKGVPIANFSIFLLVKFHIKRLHMYRLIYIYIYTQRSFGGCSTFLNYLSAPFIERRHYREFLDIPPFIEMSHYREILNVPLEITYV